MSIHEDIPFDNQGEPIHKSLFRTLFLPLVIVLVAALCFGIGRLSRGQGSPGVKIIDNAQFPISNLQSNSNDQLTNENSLKTENSKIAPSDGTASVYASSKGKKYYYTNCHSTVSAANKITFLTHELAEKAGYTLAANCHP